jgi:hypothetical protein
MQFSRQNRGRPVFFVLPGHPYYQSDFTMLAGAGVTVIPSHRGGERETFFLN